MINEIDKKSLLKDTDGLLCYEYLANNISECTPDDIEQISRIMSTVDLNGQFMASAAKYLHAIDPEVYAGPVRSFVAAVIDKDREHRYLPSLLSSLYGDDCRDRAEQLCATDDNFRRIFKRLYPQPDKF